MSIRDELKRLKKEEAGLAKKKRALTAKIKKARKQSANLAAIVKKSGYKTPQAKLSLSRPLRGSKRHSFSMAVSQKPVGWLGSVCG